MPAIAPDDLALLRGERHRSKEYLAVLRPATILACQVNGTPSGDPVTEVNYDSVTEGSYSDVVPGMSLWVGSAAGKRDKGTCRIRKDPTSSKLYVCEDSAIDWQDGDHLTVVENYEFWVKYPRIVVDGDNITFYKDWDTAYSDQHEDWPPVAVMGPPDCQFIDPTSGVATVKFVGEFSYPVAPGASISSYSWTFPDGTPSSSSSAGTEGSPVEVTWDTPGTYWVSLTVTDSNGKTHTGRRPIFIFPKTGAGAPYIEVKMPSRMGSLNQHGHTASFEVHGDADQAQFPDRALVIFFTRDWYGDTQKSIGGNSPYRSHIKFVGYIQKESTQKDPQTSMVTFDAATINALMDSREGFSSWIKTAGSPDNWCEATKLTADRAALSLCRNNSTLLDITDVRITGDSQYIKSQEFAAKTSLLQQLQSLYNSLFAHVACDRQGAVYFDKDPQMLAVADRFGIAIVADLVHGDWRERLDLPRPQEPKTSFINLEGVHYPGWPAKVMPILSKAPGNAPGYMGTTRPITGLILSGQADGNEKAGLALAYDNNEFPVITLPMAGLWDIFDIVPQEYVRLSLAATDTKRGIVWTNQKLIPRQVTLTVEETEQGRVLKVSIQVEKDSYGPAGVDGDYPSEVPEPDVDHTPSAPLPPPTPGGEKGDGHLLYFVDWISGHVFRSRNARASNPGDVVYEDLGEVDAGGLTYIALDSWDPNKRAMVVGPNGVWRTANLNDDAPTFTQVLDLTTPGYLGKMACSSIVQQGLWMVVCQTTGETIRVYWSVDDGETWDFNGWSAVAGNNDFAKIECSSHDAQVAWVTWNSGGGVPIVTRTIDLWSSFSHNALGTTSGNWPANPHHPFLDNAADNKGFYASANDTKWCSADYSTCADGVLDGGGKYQDRVVHWIGSYTWGTDRYWALTRGLDPGVIWRLHVSDDCVHWTRQYDFSGTTRFISGWPYLGERFYACQDGTAAPILISDDRGQNWQAQTGNWADICTALGISPEIFCCVPVWIK